MTSNSNLSPNDLAFIALCNEYCEAICNAPAMEKEEFIQQMLRLLPRIYITASDIKPDVYGMAGNCIEPKMDEAIYESVRGPIAALLGEDDAYLEVLHEDMKYSDMPIGASISKGLADLMQVSYDLVETIKELPTEMIADALAEVRESFNEYWSQTLCNVLRPLNQLNYNIQ